MKAFVSHANEDLTYAKALSKELHALGVEAFLANRDLKPGDKWESVTETALRSADWLIIVWSENASRSPWVMREITSGLLHEKRIIPLLKDTFPLSPLLSAVQALDATDGQLPVSQLAEAIGLDAANLIGHSAYSMAADAYRAALRRRLEKLRALGTNRDYDLKDVFLTTHLATADGKEILPSDILQQGSTRCVLLGHPGSGKSTNLAHLGLLACEDNARVPVIVRLASYLKTKKSVEEYIADVMNGIAGQAMARTLTTSDRFCDDSYILMIDGLDEVSEVDQDGFVAQLASFTTRFPLCSIIVTSRYSGACDIILRDYHCLNLLPLADPEIERYVRAVVPPANVAGFFQLLRDNERLFELAHTPFLLALMCMAPAELGSRSSQRALFLKECTKYFLKECDWEPDRTQAKPSPDELVAMETALKSVALRFFKLDLREPFSVQEVKLAIEAAQIQGYSTRSEQFLHKLITATGLLQKSGSNVTFIHRTIWEYFAALALLDEPISNIADRSTLPVWEEPIRLTIGLSTSDRVTDILEQIWPRSPALALRCATELSEFPTELIRRLLTAMSRANRLGIVMQVEQQARISRSPQERTRMLLDTFASLCTFERDCEVIFRCIEALELERSDRCQALVADILALDKAAERRDHYLLDSQFSFALVRVVGGAFRMGSDDRTIVETPAHDVTLQSFHLGSFQVTNKLYYDAFPFAVNRRDPRSLDDDQPVVFVTWYEAALFARWLGCDLPTEAQWEYACRSGGADDAALFDSNCIPEYAWFIDNSKGQTQPVGRLRPNSFGLYDMLGNVREWCSDWFDADYYSQCSATGAVTDPTGPTTGTHRVLRGGCFDWNVANLMPTYRNYNPADNSYFANGFRLAYNGRNYD